MRLARADRRSLLLSANNVGRAAASSGDPYFANVTSLLHFDGTDGSTTITDVKGNTWTAGGNAQLDTAVKKYGTASLLLDGVDDFINSPHGTWNDLSTGDFTIEFWYYPNSIALAQVVFRKRSSNNLVGILLTQPSGATSKLRYHLGDSNSASWNLILTSSSSISAGQWYHVAMTREGDVFNLYINGVCEATGTAAAITLSCGSGTIAFGTDESLGSDCTAQFDDFRLTKGVARYSGSSVGVTYFTPPAAALPDA